MYNYKRIKNWTFEDIMLLCQKADLMKGRKGRELRKALTWLLKEEY